MPYKTDKLLSTILNNIKDVVLILSEDYNVLEVNNTFKGIFTGYKKIIGNSFLDLCKTKEKILSVKEFNLLLSNKSFDKKFEASKTEILYFSWSIHNSESNGNKLFLLVGNDITNKKLDNFLTKQNQKQLERISECVPGNFYWKNLQGEYLGCNRSLLNMLGMNSVNDIIKKNDYDLWPIQAREIRKHDRKVIKSQKTVYAEESVRISNKTMFFTVIKMPLYGDNNNVIGIVGNSLDITNQKNMEKRLKKAKEDAEVASIAKTEFIANMSHDIRTPLSGVLGLGYLVEKEIIDTNIKSKVRCMIQSTEELLNMLNKILDVVSLGNSTNKNTNEEPFDLYHLVQRVVNLEKASLSLKKFQFLQSIDPKIPNVLCGDHKKIHHILLNLVGNAIKFTEKGHISINIKLSKKLKDKVKLLFEVVDTGYGIPKESLNKIFELFYKITPSYKTIGSGHGIGLHIVKTYVELLGGNVFVESKENEGSKFSFSLMLNIASENSKPQNIKEESLMGCSGESNLFAPSVANQESSTTHISNAPEILLIEDNDIARKVATCLIEEAKCNYSAANDGEMGLELAKKQNFNLILTDIGLPGISGIEFAKQFREHERQSKHRPVPIVAITGHAMGNIYDECIAAGINEVIIKPIRPQILDKIIARFCLFNDDNSRLYTDKKNISFSINSPQINVKLDLPKDEAELFKIDNEMILDIENAKKILGVKNNDLLIEMLKDTINNVIPNELLSLQKAYNSRNWQDIADISHKLKGGFLSISLSRAAKACKYLEQYYKTGETLLLEKLYRQMLKTLDETSNILKGFIK